ncbi:putative eka-like protein [Erysiphe necator]|uniref:Putative eka-like protein n=1 Tax=Uncinula necator TaxID=52586 RepID=A0A0B1P707_UNCNE|nr:putative eka-like protein [Erysiphe necator]
MRADEIERVCSVRPAHLKLYGRNHTEAPHRTWMSFFSKAPRAGFRVSDESGIARPFKKQQPIEFCKRCNGHHPTKNCSRAPSCGNCGSTNHLEDISMATTKCRNCRGPHRSDSRRCLARPTRLGTPTKEQMKTYRQAGEREFQAVLRARAAEEIAATT